MQWENRGAKHVGSQQVPANTYSADAQEKIQLPAKSSETPFNSEIYELKSSFYT